VQLGGQSEQGVKTSSFKIQISATMKLLTTTEDPVSFIVDQLGRQSSSKEKLYSSRSTHKNDFVQKE
jgi:hypothetical protein